MTMESKRTKYLKNHINSMARILKQGHYNYMSEYIVEVCGEAYTYRVYGRREEDFYIVEK